MPLTGERRREYEKRYRSTPEYKERARLTHREWYKKNKHKVIEYQIGRWKSTKDGVERVYFVKSTEMNRIKIGFTKKKMKARLRELQTGSADELEVMGILYGPVDEESRLHLKFKHLQVAREWFRCDPELVLFIEQNTSFDSDPELRK